MAGTLCTAVLQGPSAHANFLPRPASIAFAGESTPGAVLQGGLTRKGSAAAGGQRCSAALLNEEGVHGCRCFKTPYAAPPKSCWCATCPLSRPPPAKRSRPSTSRSARLRSSWALPGGLLSWTISRRAPSLATPPPQLPAGALSPKQPPHPERSDSCRLQQLGGCSGAAPIEWPRQLK